jgi:hypothetical protein
MNKISKTILKSKTKISKTNSNMKKYSKTN